MDFIVGDLVNARWFNVGDWFEGTGVVTSYDIEYHDDDEEYHYEVALTSGGKEWLPQDCLTAIVLKTEEEEKK